MEAVPDQGHIEAQAQQVEAVWSMMLSQMTEAGASREDIVSLTVQTSRAIIATTAGALWPDRVVPHGEEAHADLLRGVSALLASNT